MTKIHLTSELIARTKENIGKCSQEDLQILARETIFKKRMQRHLHYRRQQLQAWLLARKQAKIGKQMQ
ncbi:GH12535 [Drosophila grimshawi]|nr:GH12535 [Drosophila grimshawi]